MQRIMTGLGIVLLMTLSLRGCTLPAKNTLPPLNEDLVEVYWISQGEEAPFSGLLMNNYTYERIRLKLWEANK